MAGALNVGMDSLLVSVGALAAAVLLWPKRAETASPVSEGGEAGAPRGIRNNNPGNIEWSPDNDWRGQIGSDGRYVIFTRPLFGIRAMARVLDSYQRRGVDTVREIVETWAPASENPTHNYLATVRALTGFSAEQVITRADYELLIPAMIYFENGEQPYSDEQIAAGIAAA